MRRNSAGIALPLVLLLLLALTSLGHGALVLSQREVQSSAAFRDLTRAKKGAEVGLRLALALSPDPFGDRTPWVTQPILTGEIPDGLTYSAARRWINEEFFVLEGRGGVKGWPGQVAVASVGWTLHPGARLSAFLATLEAGSELRIRETSILTTDGFFSSPEGWPAEVGGGLLAWAKATFPAGPLPVAAGGVPETGQKESGEAGTSYESAGDGKGIPGLGLLAGPELLRRALTGKEEASAEADGSGVGCPGSSEKPVFRGSSGSVSLPKGRVCGLVVIGGDLTIRAGTVFQGLALVGGNLLIELDGKFEGMARVGNGVFLEGGAIFSGTPIPAIWALEGIRSLFDPLAIHMGPLPRW